MEDTNEPESGSKIEPGSRTESGSVIEPASGAINKVPDQPIPEIIAESDGQQEEQQNDSKDVPPTPDRKPKRYANLV
jgi:hypothetical protein